MVAFGYFIMKRLIFDLVDEVVDAGDALMIRNRGQEPECVIRHALDRHHASSATRAFVTRGAGVMLSLTHAGRLCSI